VHIYIYTHWGPAPKPPDKQPAAESHSQELGLLKSLLFFRKNGTLEKTNNRRPKAYSKGFGSAETQIFL
jgi:hypothetical protein